MTPVRGLDPFPSRGEIERLYRDRTGRDLPTDADFKRLAPGRLQAPAWDEAGRIRPGAIGERLPNGLKLSLPVPPRTKKNGGKGGFAGIKQRPAYRRFRDQVIELVAPLKAHLQLPLPDVPYNIAAVYYVDRPGEQADKPGLDNGLYDALENAGVINDDWYFRTDDGSRIVFGDAHPRVEITITTIPQE